MADLYKNKYRIPPARLQIWDYGSNGVYFITIVTKYRRCFFGCITDNNMHLSEEGKIAEQFWLAIPNHFPFIELSSYVVMPNHIHGILIISKEDQYNKNTVTIKDEDESKITIGQKRHGNQGKGTISSIIGSYKSAVSKNIRYTTPDFGWQTRFHDHIIQNSESFNNIQKYIDNNPSGWIDDKFYSP